MSSPLVEELARVSGIAPIFARAVIRRAVQRAGLDPEALRASELDTLAPELERALRVYLGDAAPRRVAEIRAKLGR